MGAKQFLCFNNYTELIPGRMQAEELIINDKEINLINIWSK